MFLGLYLILILTALGSGMLVFFLKPGDQRALKIMLAFSGAFLIGITFMELVPEVFGHAGRFTGLFVLLGFLLQLFLELITEGVEHGHKHDHSDHEKASPFLLLIGLSIHSFLEGMPIISGFDEHLLHTLVTGIVIHNLPISLVLMSMFLHYGCSRTRAFLYLLVFSLMTPLGSLFSQVLDTAFSAAVETWFNYILAVVIGIFLHVSTSILFEAEENHRYNLQKFITVLAGLALAIGLSMADFHVH